MLHYLCSRFARIEPTTSLSVFISWLPPPFCQHFVFFSWFLSSTLICLPLACRPPSLSPHPACLFTFSAFFSPTWSSFSYLSFFLSTAAHTPPRPFALSTHISSFLLSLSLLSTPFLKSPLVFFDSNTSSLCRCLIPNMHRIPVAHPPLLHPLSGCCPHCHHHRQAASLAVPAGLTPATLTTLCEGITATKCVFVRLYLCVPVSICERLEEESLPSALDICPACCCMCVSLSCLVCLSLTSPSVSVYVSALLARHTARHVD